MTQEEINQVKYKTVKEAWKFARQGVIIFAIIHLVYDILIENPSKFPVVIVNYFVCAWWIKRQIVKGTWQNTILYGMSVASIVFIIQIVLGTIITSLI
jgi:hypothetical protein